MVIVGFGHHWVPFVGDTEDLRKERKGSKKEHPQGFCMPDSESMQKMLQNAMVVVAIGHHWVPFVGDTEDLRKQRKKEQTGANRSKHVQNRAKKGEQEHPQGFWMPDSQSTQKMLQNAMVIVAFGRHWVPFVGAAKKSKKREKQSKEEQNIKIKSCQKVPLQKYGLANPWFIDPLFTPY